LSKGPVSPAEYGDGMDDAQLEEAGYAAGLDVWGQVEKAYGNYLGDGTLSNSQLWSLKQAILAGTNETTASRPVPMAEGCLK